MSEKFTGHGIVGPMAAPGPADFYDCLTPKKFPPKNRRQKIPLTSALKIDFSRFSKPKCAKRQVGAILTKMTIFGKGNA